MSTPPLHLIARRFPLVARPRPAGAALAERVESVWNLARATVDDDGPDRLSLAASACNQAALIASDCGRPDLARLLCWHHHEAYAHVRPLNARTAQLALEPIVNLARLLIRDGLPDDAYQLLSNLYRAARTGATITAAGIVIDMSDLVAAHERRTLCEWLWSVLLGDGTRALTSAGRWGQALRHAEQHHGIGQRLLDGRQVAILDRAFSPRPADALQMIHDSVLVEPWETAVASALRLLCLHAAGQPTQAPLADAIALCLDLPIEPRLAVFGARLGLVIYELAEGDDPRPARHLLGHVASNAVRDGYAARDILDSEAATAALTPSQRGALTAAMQRSDFGDLPRDLATKLIDTVWLAADTIAGTLQRQLHSDKHASTPVAY